MSLEEHCVCANNERNPSAHSPSGELETSLALLRVFEFARAAASDSERDRNAAAGAPLVVQRCVGVYPITGLPAQISNFEASLGSSANL